MLKRKPMTARTKRIKVAVFFMASFYHIFKYTLPGNDQGNWRDSSPLSFPSSDTIRENAADVMHIAHIRRKP
jgi:hypothetical protein